MASDWAYKKAKDLSDRGWLGEAEFEEEQEDHIYTVAQALREARAEGMREAAKLKRYEDALVKLACIGSWCGPNTTPTTEQVAKEALSGEESAAK